MSYFETCINNLDKWYQEMMSVLDAQKVKQLDIKYWAEYKEDESFLYYDEASGDALYDNILSLMNLSAERSQSIASNA
ncbi:MAG: hypothetical protein ACK5LM_03080 [Lactovum sp.]